MSDFLAGTRAGLLAGRAAAIAQAGGSRTQRFPTQPVPNYKPAVYALQIRDSGGGVVDSYLFPMSPESVRKESSALTTFYDVQGNESNYGVQRIIDIFGQTPVIYTIEGTTGWKMHFADGFQYTGLQSVQRIENLLLEFVRLNQTKLADGDNTLYELWFLDLFRGEYWQVVPAGPQGVRQTAQRPLYVNYAFRLVGVRNLADPPTLPPDPLSSLLSQSDVQNALVVTQFFAGLSAAYEASTVIVQ